MDLTKAQGDLALASQLNVLADGMKKKVATETSKLATLKADADGALKKSCKLLGDDVPGCVASKLKGQQSTIEGLSATLKGMVEFEQTLNKDILATFARNSDKTCAILVKTASDVATQVSQDLVVLRNTSMHLLKFTIATYYSTVEVAHYLLNEPLDLIFIIHPQCIDCVFAVPPTLVANDLIVPRHGSHTIRRSHNTDCVGPLLLCHVALAPIVFQMHTLAEPCVCFSCTAEEGPGGPGQEP